jgi:hypothetical protein
LQLAGVQDAAEAMTGQISIQWLWRAIMRFWCTADVSARTVAPKRRHGAAAGDGPTAEARALMEISPRPGHARRLALGLGMVVRSRTGCR